VTDMMTAMVLERPGEKLQAQNRVIPDPGPGQILVRVLACGVCRTDLHVVDGDLKNPSLPVVPGHEIVGEVAALGPNVERYTEGDRIGVPWLGWTCGVCRYCSSGRENLCDHARFTGYTLDGGYADYMLADERYCFRVSGDYDAVDAAPLLCAGLIGYRSLRMAGDGENVGLYGFGAAAHIVAQILRHQGRKIFAFVRPGDDDAIEFAYELGAIWAGSSTDTPPDQLDAAIIFAPVGALVPAALGAVSPGGIVVCAGIHMSDIPSFPYDLLWRERKIVSVANLTRLDGEEFLDLAPKIPVRTTVERFALSEANEALAHLREGRLRGAAVLVPEGT
jgi:alcohol dehydrogenase, propanol-preferring